jgi:aspartate aminotransferase
VSTQLASRLSAVAPSATLAMAARAARLREQGHRVFAFGVGEPDFATPAPIREAAKKAIDVGCSHYTAVTGTATLKKAICAATERDRGWSPTVDQVVVSCGAKHALFNLALALYEPGDEVVIPAPYWVSYPEQVRLAGANPVIVPTREEDNWLLSEEALANALTPRTKAIILCTPSNPTGAAYPRERLLQLAKVLSRSDAFVIVDEIYAELVYAGFEHHSLAALAPGLRDRLIVVDGVSKTYAMTGWRIGWSIGPPSLVKALDIIQGQSTTNPTAVSQEAAAFALTGPRADALRMRAAFAERRGRMVEGLRSVPGVRCRMPDGAFYAFADVRGLYGLRAGEKKLASDEDVATWLLDVAHVAAVPGTPFGAPGYLRFSYASAIETIDEGIAAMRQAVEKARSL